MKNLMLLAVFVAQEISSVFSGEITSEASSIFGSASNIMQSLKIMGFGMLGIFVVTAVIVLMVTLLNKITSGIKKKDNNDK